VKLERETLLVTLTGVDRPGVTAALFAALGPHEAEVLDVEQVVIRGHLILGVLLAPGRTSEVVLAVHTAASQLGMQVSLAPGVEIEDPRRRGRLLVTLLGAPLVPAAFAAVATCIAGAQGNIDAITRVASEPVTAIELRTALAHTASANRIDIAVQPAGLRRRGQLLVVMDVDSTFIRDEVIELLAEVAGCGEEVKRITAATMSGELDFSSALKSRVALLAGQPVSILDRCAIRSA
jgi:phosphoserine phosphatase